MEIKPATLAGQFVRLEPLALDHLEALVAVGLDPELWRWTTTQVSSAQDMRDYIAAALREQQRGVALPFATVERATETVIGSTRFGNIDVTHRRAEIGWTWVASEWQRTAANTEAKYLMLRHGFEHWGCLRVEFKTDSLNERSRAAILRLGATEEGTLRNHMLTDSGRRRHSVYFSVVEEEWPAVKKRLEDRLARPR